MLACWHIHGRDPVSARLTLEVDAGSPPSCSDSRITHQTGWDVPPAQVRLVRQHPAVLDLAEGRSTKQLDVVIKITSAQI